MPMYMYEAADPDKGCKKCRGGSRIQRIIQAPGLAHSKTDLHYRAKRAGFHSLKRVNKGEYEKMY